MAEKETRKRIFAREQVQVDERTGGIRGASRPSSALGNVYGRSNTNAGYAKGAAIWGAVSGTLGKLMAHVETKAAEESAEARRERERLEQLEDQRQSLEGARMGDEINQTLREKWTRGEIEDRFQAEQYVRERLEEAAPVAATPFHNAVLGQTLKGLEFVGAKWNEKLSADLQNTGRSMAAGALTSLYHNLENLDDQEFAARVTQISSTAKLHGVSQETANLDVFNAGISRIVSAGLAGDMISVHRTAELMTTSGLANSVPIDAENKTGERRIAEALNNAIRGYNARDKQEQDDFEVERRKSQQDNYDKFLTAAEFDAYPTSLRERRSQLEALSPEDAFAKYGPKAGDMIKLLDNQIEYRQSGRKPVGNDDAIREIKQRVLDGDQAMLWDEDVLGGYVERLTKDDMLDLKSYIKQVRAKEDPDQLLRVHDTLKHLNTFFGDEKNNTVMPYHNVVLLMDVGEGKQVPTRGGIDLRDQFLKDLRSISRKDFPDDLSYRRALDSIERQFIDRVKSGKIDLSYLGGPPAADAKAPARNLLAITKDEWNDPQYRDRLDKMFLAPNVAPADAVQKIKQLQDPGLKSHYSLMNANRIANVLVAKIKTAEAEAERMTNLSAQHPVWRFDERAEKISEEASRLEAELFYKTGGGIY